MNSIKDLLMGENPERAFKLIVQAYHVKVVRFISLFVFNILECEELASDVFISLWTKRHKLIDVTNLDNYIFVMAKNRALNHLRKGKLELIDIDSFNLDVFYNTVTNPESIYITKETVEDLNSIINELPHKTKLAFHLVREDNMKYKDAAEILNVSTRTIEKQVASAVSKLKNRLKR